MSMISEFVKELREKLALFSKSDFAVAGIAKDYKEAADIIEELSAKLASANMERSEQYYKDIPDTNVGKWIPVSERLPGHYECVLACCNDEFVTIASLNSQEKRWECLTNMSSDTHFPEGEEVIAWMPLPEPYKGE